MRYSTSSLVLVVMLSSCVGPQSTSAFQSSSFGVSRNTRLLVSPLHQAFNNEDYFILSTTNNNNINKRQKRDQVLSLKAFTIEQVTSQSGESTISSGISQQKQQSTDWNEVQRVLTTALMVTGNTIGAGALVVPELAAKPGMAISTGLFGAAYIINLISGLILAEVAIKQHESAGTDVPASFKEFADENLDSPSASTFIAGISLFTNACVLSFDLHRAGDVANNVLGGVLGPTLSMVGFATALVALVSTQKGDTISKVASAMVMALFASFFGLLVPGLANVTDPMSTFFAPGSNPDIMSGITEATPIILMTMIYQNIVPTVTKILDYDRAQTTAAITLGSFLPLCLYLAWCFACIGGGVDLHSVGGPLMMIFSMTAVTGSSLGCAMSLSEEVDTFLGSKSDAADINEKKSDSLNALSVATSVGVPLIAAHLFAGGEDFTAALKIAGSYGSPLLYFCIPAIMAWTQRQKVQDALPNLVPGGSATLVGLGVASVGLIGQEFVADVGSFFAAANPVVPL